MAKLGDFMRIKHGFAFKGDYITAEDNEIVLVTPGNFEIGGGFKEKKCKFFSGDYPKDYVLHADDLIVTMTDLSKQGDTLGYSARVPNSNRIYLHNQRIGLVDVFNPNADKDYLYWFMRTPQYQKKIVATASGSTVKHTSPSRICDVEINLPSIDKQKKIASLLTSIEKKIHISERINDNLEQQAAALFSSLYNRSNTEVRYTDLIQILGGGTPKTGETAYWNGNIAFFTPKDVGTPYTFITEKTITEEGLSHCNSRLYPVNTVFVTARGTVGKVGLSGVPMAMNQSCYALVGKETHQLLVYFYTLKAVDRLKHKASGAVFDAITTRDFDSEQIMKLSDDNAKAFLYVAEPMFQEILNNSIENLQLSTLRDFLLPKLMSGEIDVSSVQL
ncbi:restriction endonuclease subunit S [Faecalibacterium prausnitzii]|jgi:type I restriction enzyme S subunit|uniref:restriction endonuclease subunit S n=1 Tax=Faecalibacterium prausnitzii TaxID=853 RepID=UPI002912ACB3|nr:restriction endonuclease subunit S [Faecalibacterium prausnitzii]MDU8669916.1 restriction endonuclease subunit S [Faecalibacterium prausnitzii]